MEFRKKLRWYLFHVIPTSGWAFFIGKQQKKVLKSVASEQKTDGVEISQSELIQHVRTIKKESFPTTAEDREQYFSVHVNQGEQLHLQGCLTFLPQLLVHTWQRFSSGQVLPSALHFYRALCVYPNPIDLIQIYQRAVPPSVFKLLVELWTLGATDAINNDIGSPETKTKTTSGTSSETSSQEWENLMESNLRI